MNMLTGILLFFIGSSLAQDGVGPDGGGPQPPLPPGPFPPVPTDGPLPPLPTDGPLPPLPTDGPLPPLPTDGPLPPLPTDAPIPTDPPLPPLPTGTPPQPETPVPPTQKPPKDCKDKAYNCKQLQNACRTSWNIKNYWCKETCGTCAEGNCKDNISNCWNNKRFCSRPAVAIQCQRTCKVCS
ncbi:formin-1 isoform X2 [Exaiptasia diaphana]|uniref:ShKT domain-containing protein n=1 Tax=Exaiptasia diaphana TaxID=2652724 RepID=A0A913Y8A3_EXADI|nr:formin-1 isoform X2 [Exaiptasia diaphana]